MQEKIQKSKSQHVTDESPLLRLPCRYYRVYTDEDVQSVEANFSYVERELAFPVVQSALVLVDVWNMHHTDSYLERSMEVTRHAIVPLLEAARAIGMTVIHAPSPLAAQRYSEKPNAPATPATTPREPGGAERWPPAEFAGIYRGGQYAEFGRQQEPTLATYYARARSENGLDIAELARPRPGELVIANGAELHQLLTKKKILHLFYCGFATNWCVLLRDYGMIAMCNAGYNLILLRDATTGIEGHDTVDTLTATAMAIREIEAKYAWSAQTGDFVQSCRSISP